MNERIKELAKLSGFGPGWFETSPPGHPALPREGIIGTFAELIVKECAKVASDHVGELEGVDFGLIERCYQHFGISE